MPRFVASQVSHWTCCLRLKNVILSLLHHGTSSKVSQFSNRALSTAALKCPGACPLRYGLYLHRWGILSPLSFLLRTSDRRNSTYLTALTPGSRLLRRLRPKNFPHLAALEIFHEFHD